MEQLRRHYKGPGKLRLSPDEWRVATFAYLYREVVNLAFDLKWGTGEGSAEFQRQQLRSAGERCREAWCELQHGGKKRGAARRELKSKGGPA
jgi:hypothetical protein